VSSTRATPGTLATDAQVEDFDRFVERLGGHLDLPLDGATADDRLVDDLGFDSVAMFGLFVLLEDTAARELPIELIDSLVTLDDVWHWHSTLAQQPASQPDGHHDPAPAPGPTRAPAQR
jgi:acyl carrier protein